MPATTEGRFRSRISLAIAIAAHAALIASARVARSPSPPPRVASEAADLVVDLGDVPVVPLAPSPVAAVPVSPSQGHRAPSAERARSPASSVDLAPEMDKPATPPADPVAEAPIPAPGALSPVSLEQLGLAGPNRYVEAPPAASKSSARAAEDDLRRSIDESLLRHDRGVGLGAEGPAIAVIERVVLASTAAVNGKAVLSVVADALGFINQVACVDGDHAQWDAIAADVRRLLERKRLRTAPGGHGVALRVEVTSREQLPSGRDPGLEVRVLNVPVKRGRGPHSTRIDVLGGLDVFKLDGDPSDIGASARRVVHARVLDEEPL